MGVHCGKCNIELDESPNTKPSNRLPCPNCGSTSRSFDEELKDGISQKEKVSIIGKHGGKGAPFIKQSTGDDLNKKTGKWMKREMVVDRDNDRYLETVTDPETGEVVHHCDEPLSKHTGHGDAKPKSQGLSNRI